MHTYGGIVKYIEMKIFTEGQGVEPLSSILFDLGLTEFVYDDEGEPFLTLYLDDSEDG